MEKQKRGVGVAAVTVPPMLASESNKISIIISPRAASSKVMPFELLNADPVESSDAHAAAHYHRWNQGLSKIKAVPLIKKVVAEFVGTFILIFTLLSTIIKNEQHDGVESLLGVATSAGLAVTVLVLSLVHISGCHLNPAVFGHLPLAHLLPYMTAQILGSIAASFSVKGIHHPLNPGIATIPKVGTTEAFFLEFITTFVLLFIITALATDTHAAINRSIDESGTHTWPCNCHRKVHPDLDLHSGNAAGCYSWNWG